MTATASKPTASAIFPDSLLLPLRIFMGLTFLYAGLQHLTDSSYFDPSKSGYIGHLVSQYAVGSPIHDFLLGVVVPNAVAFGYMVGVGEALIGIAVLLGFLFRIASLAGLILNFTFFLSATWNAFPFYFGSDIVFVMCWLTLLLTGPQVGLSVDGRLSKRVPAFRWLIGRYEAQSVGTAVKPEVAVTQNESMPLPKRAALYPKQVIEVNRAFDRIGEQFLGHEETRTILEFVRAFVISLGVDRADAAKILSGLQNILNRDSWTEPAPEPVTQR
ncbi:MAG: TQO small subunit DoxD [Candidatus Bathyarchaeia archaeon]